MRLGHQQTCSDVPSVCQPHLLSYFSCVFCRLRCAIESFKRHCTDLPHHKKNVIKLKRNTFNNKFYLLVSFVYLSDLNQRSSRGFDTRFKTQYTRVFIWNKQNWLCWDKVKIAMPLRQWLSPWQKWIGLKMEPWETTHTHKWGSDKK